MHLLIITGNEKEVAGCFQPAAGLHISFFPDADSLPAADACLDLAFDYRPLRLQKLAAASIPLIFIHAVKDTLAGLPSHFIRINAWPGFLNNPVIEAAATDEPVKKQAAALLALLGKKTEWVPDITGLITPRILCTIINEAYYALQEGVSTREEIDAALKNGTNYPYGPFEWAEKIGLMQVYELLAELGKEHIRYTPCELLKTEAIASGD
ncbi:MAG TPA: 3-hydroxyacyl-CoA dehydrogenase family protein [Chitinophagaceae bacterium]|nr:3-hydroxyacyl-CoA dehydrogenase family protein [Chitinophagaceae bacterium]